MTPATLNNSRPQPADEDEPTTPLALDHTTDLTTLPVASDPPAPALPFTASPEATHDDGPTTTPHPRIIIRLPERLMTKPAVERRDESDEGNGSKGEATRPTHDASYVGVVVAPCLPIAFSSHFQPVYPAVSSSGPPNVREAMAAPDADQWKGAMGREMENFKSHDVYELVSRTNGMRTLELG